MINGHEVKREIVAKRYKDSDRLALLSGFVRVSFSVLRRGGERHLVLDCQTDFVFYPFSYTYITMFPYVNS